MVLDMYMRKQKTKRTFGIAGNDASPTIPKTQKSISAGRYWDDSPVGPGIVSATMEVGDASPTSEPFATLKLRWEPEYTVSQPGTWEIHWFHLISVVGGRLKGYLDKWCPCADEVYKTLLDGLPAEIKLFFTEIPD